MLSKDWNLLVIAAAEGKPLTPVQLQKSLFVFGEECPQATKHEYYQFVPYHYGPFDSKVYQDAALLCAEGLVYIRPSVGGWREYSATSEGLERAKELEGYLTPKHAEYLHAVVTWARSLTFDQLIRAIYKKYPAYKVNSVFQPQ